ncbi:hypothetical protein NM208_g15471 [Fusarium decemcellulare]|uniref:Uncharacterized protein n=1 Tax=Fusarium decemcellulare TaxID=57161 RepID=A0ACC1RFJ8_9HYPO|nr:hypothetical protein NM208_g15471 [Fusarium decemcellulare]
MRFSLSTLVALGALQTFGVYAQDDCSIPACIERVKGLAPTYDCPDPANADCVCGKEDFAKGIAECARPCGTSDSEILSNVNGGFCAAKQLASLPAATSSGAATTSEALSTTSGAPTTTDAPTSSSAAPETTSEAVESTTASSSAAAESTATESASASASPSASASATDQASSTEGAAGAGATSDSSAEDDSKDDDSSGSGLSKSAQIGIGIGVTVGILALLGIAFCFWRRRNQRNNLPRGNAAISHPMPGGGRNYASADQGSIGEKHGYDLEMMSHRYEDMLPRQKPRTMV